MVHFYLKSDEGTRICVLVSDKDFVSEGIVRRFWRRNHDFLDLGLGIYILNKVDGARSNFPVLTEQRDLRNVWHERLCRCVEPQATNHGETVLEDRLDDVGVDSEFLGLDGLAVATPLDLQVLRLGHLHMRCADLDLNLHFSLLNHAARSPLLLVARIWK